MTVSAPGFATVTQENIDLTGMRVQEVAVQLPVSTVSTNVTVTGAPPAVETDEARTGGEEENGGATHVER